MHDVCVHTYNIGINFSLVDGFTWFKSTDLARRVKFYNLCIWLFLSHQVIPFPMSCDIRDECSCRDPNAIENRKDEHVLSLGWPSWAGTSVHHPRTRAPTPYSQSGQGRPLLHPPFGLQFSCTCCFKGIPLHSYCNSNQLKGLLLCLLLPVLHLTERSRIEAGIHRELHFSTKRKVTLQYHHTTQTARRKKR